MVNFGLGELTFQCFTSGEATLAGFAGVLIKQAFMRENLDNQAGVTGFKCRRSLGTSLKAQARLSQ